MTLPFQRSERALERRAGHRSSAAGVAASALLLAWGAWLFLSRVAVYRVAESARLEAASSAHRVEPPVAGRVLASSLELGRHVDAGEVLLVLDARAESLQLAEETARERTLAEQVRILRMELDVEEGVQDRERRLAHASVATVEARRRAARAAIELGEQEQQQLTRLNEASLVSGLELLGKNAELRQKRGVADILASEVHQASRSEDAAVLGRQLRALRLRRESSVLEGQHELSKVAMERLALEVARRTLRAPVGGTIGSVVAAPPGSFVAAGAPLATIVPDGELRIVAEFAAASAAGRVLPGQRAYLRLDGFSWTQYGAIDATVTHVAEEAHDGRLRVELAAASRRRIPWQHGLTGVVEVEIERSTPAIVALRAAGHAMTSRATAPEAGP